MINRKSIAVIAIALSTVSVATFADYDERNTARELLREARAFGQPAQTGIAAGNTARSTDTQRDTEARADKRSEWQKVLDRQTLNGD